MKSGTIEGVVGSYHLPNYNVPSVPELSGKNPLVPAGLVCRMPIMGCVYLAQNRVNGKRYVGKTSRTIGCRKGEHKNEAQRGGGSYFHKALHKYGFENFDWKVLFTDEEEEELNQIETLCIRQFKSKVPNGYNLTDGGEGMINPPEEVRKRIGNALRGKTRPPEVCRAISAGKKGSKHTPETCKLIGDIHRGKKRGPLDLAIIEKIRNSNIGKKRTPETCRLIGDVQRGKPKPKPPDFGEIMKRAWIKRRAKQ